MTYVATVLGDAPETARDINQGVDAQRAEAVSHEAQLRTSYNADAGLGLAGRPVARPDSSRPALMWGAGAVAAAVIAGVVGFAATRGPSTQPAPVTRTATAPAALATAEDQAPAASSSKAAPAATPTVRTVAPDTGTAPARRTRVRHAIARRQAEPVDSAATLAPTTSDALAPVMGATSTPQTITPAPEASATTPSAPSAAAPTLSAPQASQASPAGPQAVEQAPATPAAAAPSVTPAPATPETPSTTSAPSPGA